MPILRPVRGLGGVLLREIRTVLTVAGLDSGGGAGLGADLKTFAALGVYGTSVVTAITAQNTQAVRAVYPLSPENVVAQIQAVREDFDIACVKIGMLATGEIVQCVGDALEGLRIVYDPVLYATTGARLMSEGFLDAVRHFLPRVEVLMPNLSEAARLLDVSEALSEAEMIAQGQALLRLGPRAVVMKGGHLSGCEAVDIVITHQRHTRFATPRLTSPNLHGTGCVLSSALASYLAQGAGLEEALERAKTFTCRAIEAGAGVRLGRGSGPLLPEFSLCRS